MSVEAIWWAFNVDAGDAGAKLVLLALANHANGDHECWPSQKRLGEMCNLTDRSVRDALARLEGRDIIRRVQRRREDGSRATDRIVLQVQLPENSSATTGKDFPTPRKQTPPHPPENSSGLTLFEPVIKETSEEPNAREIADAIWKASPQLARQRSSQEKTRKAICKAIREGKNPREIQGGLSGYYASPGCTKEGGQFAPGVHRAISEGRWEGFTAEVIPFPDAPPTEFQRKVWTTWIEEFMRYKASWRLERGPRPDEPGCVVPLEVMVACGYNPPRRMEIVL